jgi:hypothetical protein
VSPLTAAVVLGWGGLAVLALAMAGILRQLRELQAEVAQLGAPSWHGPTGRRVPELAGDRPMILLLLDPGCGGEGRNAWLWKADDVVYRCADGEIHYPGAPNLEQVICSARLPQRPTNPPLLP